eukprot:1050657-Alexandrium_andersonii.AAC.1
MPRVHSPGPVSMPFCPLLALSRVVPRARSGSLRRGLSDFKPFRLDRPSSNVHATWVGHSTRKARQD